MGEAGGDRKQTVVDAKLIKAFEDAGYPPDEIARLKARAVEDARGFTIVVEPENADAVRIFRQMQTQWRITPITLSGRGGSRVLLARTGLDYGVLPPVAVSLGIVLREETMDALRLLEAETLAIHAHRQEQFLRS